MNIQIKNRWSGALLWDGDAEDIRSAVVAAAKSDAYLRDAYLRGADLRDAYLRDAYLRGADLRDADLRDADLRGADLNVAYLRNADLSGADLRGADLNVAYLRDADLRDADLRDADLSGADLRDADLSGADLNGAYLRGADLRGADLSGANLSGAIPIIGDIDRKILEAIEAGGKLNMGDWHTCQTTHCRGGWAIHLAGESGRKLESKIGVAAAASLIYAVSRPGKRVPDFYADNETAMADIRESAGVVSA